MKRTLLSALFLLAVVATLPAQQRSIDQFLAAFTADWIRQNPNQAASTRFFTGEEQRQFERQITPLMPEWRRARVTLAERSLDELNRIAKASSLTDSQRVSADLMRWQLETFIRSDRYNDYLVALELENTDLPQFRQIRAFGPISAFSEGWGLYAERLAAELGWYDGDPEGLLGQLDSALFRARRLVVDTGLHAKRWTRQQAIDYGIEASEVERYVVNPGQACSYMIGQLKIVELREKTRAALGNRFSIREFHNVVLGTGSVPLDLLERQVDAYIRSSRGL